MTQFLCMTLVRMYYSDMSKIHSSQMVNLLSQYYFAVLIREVYGHPTHSLKMLNPLAISVTIRRLAPRWRNVRHKFVIHLIDFVSFLS